MTRHRHTLAEALLVILALLAPTPAMAQVSVFHSPNDDGTAPAELVEVAPGSHTVHVYLQTGSTPSAEPCDLGGGDEVCQWLVYVTAQGPITFQSFAPVGDVRWRIEAAELNATGGDFDQGQLGVFKLGDLAIDAQDVGAITLAYGEVASADLSRAFVEPSDLFMVPEPSFGWLLACGAGALAGLARLKWGA